MCSCCKGVFASDQSCCSHIGCRLLSTCPTCLTKVKENLTKFCAPGTFCFSKRVFRCCKPPPCPRSGRTQSRPDCRLRVRGCNPERVVRSLRFNLVNQPRTTAGPTFRPTNVKLIRRAISLLGVSVSDLTPRPCHLRAATRGRYARASGCKATSLGRDFIS